MMLKDRSFYNSDVPHTKDHHSASVELKGTYSRRFKSRRVTETDKFWLERARPREERIGRMLPPIAMLIGFAVLIVCGCIGYSESPKHRFREVWFDDFTDGLDTVNSWNHEIALGGYGAGTFDWTTDYANNSFVQDGKLYIYPTLTAWPPQQNGSFVNLTLEGICSLDTTLDCYAYNNASSYQIINPVQSARLTTEGKRTLRFGKIDIRAKMPRGRYLWPALWFMPQNSTYGIWPASGEIDLFEGRGNDPTKSDMWASNCMQSSAHWGPYYSDASEYVELSTKQTHISCWPRHSLTESFHTYTLEWTPQGLLYYIDDPLYIMHSIPFKEGPFKTVILTEYDSLGIAVPNPWSSSPLKAAPFDQEFYLIMNVAVGGTNGWFEDDDVDNPAYTNSGETGGESYEAVHNFWRAQHQWYPTWPDDLDRGMAIDFVRFSELVDCDKWEDMASARMNNE